jgi:diguanylate cyclase (GGDEF)-like protein
VLSAVATLGASAAIVGLLMNRLETVAAGLATQAHTDPVTAIANRREFDHRIALELDRSRRHGRPLSLVICDLDRFKAVNDALGHEEGDVALRRAATAIGEAVRTVDAVARLGGEEFGVILPETALEPATRIAERIRASVSDEFRSYAFQLTASCGVACTDEVEGGREELFRAADGALYLAKREGRDRVIAHPVDDPEPEAAAVWSGAE